MNLPTLYKRTSTGAIQTWHIDVEVGERDRYATIVATYGQQGGKLQIARDIVTEGKNIGKSNETTPAQQAELEAQSQWEKKQKRGYTTSVSDAAAGTVDPAFIEGGINPMLAQSYAKHGAKIVWPAYAQPKLDGHRCIAMRQNGEWTLWSRTRKPITGVPHIIAALSGGSTDWLVADSDVILDGELYNHAYRDKFEELTSFIKRPDPKPGHEVVQYHVYDHATWDSEFWSRSCDVADFIAHADSDRLVAVETIEVADEDEAMEAFASFVDQGYEGAILRNAKSHYVQKRSYDLQKVKEFQDAEFTIVGVEEGRGKMAGKAIFVCETDEGSQFRAKMKGSLDTLALYLVNPDEWIGKKLTVQFQGFTNDSQVPRFPIGLRVWQEL